MRCIICYGNRRPKRQELRRIVGAGEDVDVGMGPLWPPVRATTSLLLIGNGLPLVAARPCYHISPPYWKWIAPCGRPPFLPHLPSLLQMADPLWPPARAVGTLRR